jgi:hypothetical protein
MQKDFHYDIVYALAKEAGHDDNEAYIIAHSSQYVDDNTDREYSVRDSHGEFYVDFPDKLGKSGDLYFPVITQATDITSLESSIQRYVFAPFHFIPGDNDVEIKGTKNPLCTTRGCANAVSLVQDSLKSTDPYRMGVALHTYADTWSHERFSAFHEDWNKASTSIAGNIPPNIGHATVFHQPDEISLVWDDKRFKGKINNRDRALRAAAQIFNFVNKGKAAWDDIKADFEIFINAEDLNDRIRLIKDKYPEMESYNEDRWLNEALNFSRDASEIPEDDPFTGTTKPTRARFVDISVRDTDSHWFRFQTAAKKQLSMVLNMIPSI